MIKDIIQTVEVYLLACKYYIQQSFCDWQGAKDFATYIVRDTWK